MNRKGSVGLGLIGVLLWIPLIVMGIGEHFGAYVPYQQGCGGHLKRAADSNIIPTAKQELSQALKYLEQNEMTTGYTSIFYRTPDEDVGFWYKNLSSSLEQLDLAEKHKDMSQLESSNVLMKLRETLTDNTGGDTGTAVTEPPGIHKFPNNGTWAAMYTLTAVLACVGMACIFGAMAHSARGY